jgi:hypothetical protein
MPEENTDSLINQVAEVVEDLFDPADPASKGRLKKLLIVGGLLAAGAAIVKKMRGDSTKDNWQSGYVPTPPPTAKPEEAAPVAAVADATPKAAPEAGAADDAAGATPDEAVADAAEEPHAVTTPDAPAEVIEVDEPR